MLMNICAEQSISLMTYCNWSDCILLTYKTMSHWGPKHKKDDVNTNDIAECNLIITLVLATSAIHLLRVFVSLTWGGDLLTINMPTFIHSYPKMQDIFMDHKSPHITISTSISAHPTLWRVKSVVHEIN